MFKKVLVQYPKIFSKKLIDRGLFMNIYGQVCIRAFGYGFPSTSMVPMCDNINHSSVNVSLELINLSLHPEGSKNLDYFKFDKYMVNYETLFHNSSLNIKGRINQKVYEENCKITSTEHILECLQMLGE